MTEVGAMDLFRSVSLAALITTGLLAVACGDSSEPSSGAADTVDAGSTDVPDAGGDPSDVTEPSDDGPGSTENDAVDEQDATESTDSPDEGPSEEATEGSEETITPPGECTAETIICPEDLPQGEPDADIQQLKGMPDPLGGGDAPSGAYTLLSVDIFPDSLAGGEELLLEVEVTSNGNTFGSALFENGIFSLSANLNLSINVTLLGNSVEVDQVVDGGGCYTITGATISADLLQCAPEESNPDFELPSEFDFEADGDSLKLLVNIDKKAIIDAIPPEFAEIAGGLITDDLLMVLSLETLD